MSVQDGKLCHVGATPTYDCRSELSTGSSNNDSGHGWSEGDTGHVTEESGGRQFKTLQRLVAVFHVFFFSSNHFFNIYFFFPNHNESPFIDPFINNYLNADLSRIQL